MVPVICLDGGLVPVICLVTPLSCPQLVPSLTPPWNIVLLVIVAAQTKWFAWESIVRVWAKNYNVCHGNIVLSFVFSSHMIILTNENAELPWRTIYFCTLEPLHWRFLFIHAWTILRFFYAAGGGVGMTKNAPLFRYFFCPLPLH